MPVLGVLICEVLETEFAWLLAGDPELARVSHLSDQYSQGFAREYQAFSGRDSRHLAGLGYFHPLEDDGWEALVRVLKLGLHDHRPSLKEGVVAAAQELALEVDALLLGYGLCGNALEKPEELLAGLGIPVILPWDQDHAVDDCVGLIIGGREAYYAEQCQEAGTFFMTPGWSRHWTHIVEKHFGGEKFARRMLANYTRSLLLTTPAMPQAEMSRNLQGFDELFGLRTEARPGDMSMLTEAWQRAKNAAQAARPPARAGVAGR
ncbi:MAG: DUF1638 domain-containing protein [Deltaproteobacteria bacterium]|nr:DUF1638 domain-containing protein [Deltaproteobacteria bacterium]